MICPYKYNTHISQGSALSSNSNLKGTKGLCAKRKLQNAAPKHSVTWWSLSPKMENKKKIAYLHHCISMPPKTFLSFIRQWKLNGCWSRTVVAFTTHFKFTNITKDWNFVIAVISPASLAISLLPSYSFSCFQHQISSPILYQDCKVPSKPPAETLRPLFPCVLLKNYQAFGNQSIFLQCVLLNKQPQRVENWDA